jgi:hypothetical protein
MPYGVYSYCLNIVREGREEKTDGQREREGDRADIMYHRTLLGRLRDTEGEERERGGE